MSIRFRKTPIEGVVIAESLRHSDARGFFTRLACSDEFAGAGLPFNPRQTSLSRNIAIHTLRGMHYCTEPEAKFVRCVRGSVHDVVFDIRRDSATYGQTFGLTLDDQNLLGLYIAPGLAHGFLTLQQDSDVLYQMDRIYRPGFDSGLRWNDPRFEYPWPARPAVIDPRDANYPDFI